MNPRVKAVRPNADYTISLLFTNGGTRRFDAKPYLDKGIFRELRQREAFNSVKPVLGSIQWNGGQGFCPDTLYMDSEAVEEAVTDEWRFAHDAVEAVLARVG